MNEKARLVGINHVALEVGNIEEALAFYGQVFEFSLRPRSEKMAFIDMGDQFIALFEAHTQHPDEGRHFGLVVDDKEKVRRQLEQAGVQLLPGRGVEFRDPSGNRVQIVEYAHIQFTKRQAVLDGMGCADLHKSREAIEELARKGMAVKENRGVLRGRPMLWHKRGHIRGWVRVWRFDPVRRYHRSIMLRRGGERRADNRERYSHVVLVL
jgi:predicted enzyme related to lactoylglutathione lyase